MKDYEITYLVQNEEIYSAKPVEKEIEKLGGKLVSSKPWGQKNLAYTIGKLNVAFIVTDVFNIESHDLAKLDRQLRLHKEIIRFLIVKDVKEVPVLGGEEETRKRPEGRTDFRQAREPKVIVSPARKPLTPEVKKPAPVAMPTKEEVSTQIDKIVAPKVEETPKKTDKLLKKSSAKPVKKAPTPSSAPTDEERLKQLESKLQDLLKE